MAAKKIRMKIVVATVTTKAWFSDTVGGPRPSGGGASGSIVAKLYAAR